MTWPDKDDLKDVYNKLNQTALDGKLDWACSRAATEIKTALAARFDTSGWDTDTPPALSDLVYPMAYAFATGGVHVGSSSTPSDQVGDLGLKDAREQLKLYELGQRDLTDSDGAIISPRARGGPTVRLRTTQPIFTNRGPETQRVRVPASGEEWDG